MSRYKQIIRYVSMNEDDNTLVYHCKECMDNPSSLPAFLLIFIKAPYYFVKNNCLVRLYPNMLHLSQSCSVCINNIPVCSLPKSITAEKKVGTHDVKNNKWTSSTLESSLLKCFGRSYHRWVLPQMKRQCVKPLVWLWGESLLCRCKKAQLWAVQISKYFYISTEIDKRGKYLKWP